MTEAPLRPPLRLVIFDCDGVLVDSEPASRLVVTHEAARLGWPVTDAEQDSFTGMRWSDLQPVFERASGQKLPESWPLDMQDQVIAVMHGTVREIPGAATVLHATAALGLPYRVASNSSHEEMIVKFNATGIAELVANRVHSARDVGVGKPAPDLFLAAAAAAGVLPAQCLVVEDSRPGVTAALAAGMQCILYAPHGDPGGIARPGVRVIRDLAELPPIFATAMLERAA